MATPTVHLVWMRPDVVSIHATRHTITDGRTRVRRIGSILLNRTDCKRTDSIVRSLSGRAFGEVRIPAIPEKFKGQERWMWLVFSGCEVMQRLCDSFQAV